MQLLKRAPPILLPVSRAGNPQASRLESGRAQFWLRSTLEILWKCHVPSDARFQRRSACNTLETNFERCEATPSSNSFNQISTKSPCRNILHCGFASSPFACPVYANWTREFHSRHVVMHSQGRGHFACLAGNCYTCSVRRVRWPLWRVTSQTWLHDHP
jgi:hypothetical protein